MATAAKGVSGARSAFGKGKLFRILAVGGGAVLAGTAAYAVTNWAVSLGTGSNGLAKGASVTNITITAVATPAPTHLLYPDGPGDVVLKITNPNHFPVTITNVKLPTTSTYATGYSTSGLSTTVSGCTGSSTGSDVYWRYASTTTASTHVLTSAITVAASGGSADPLTVTLTKDAFMGTTSSTTCEGKYFKMPSFKGITAYGGGSGTPATGSITDSWTS
jgi:hypothetical protein